MYSTDESLRMEAHMQSYARIPSASESPFSRRSSYAARPEKMFRYEVKRPRTAPRGGIPYSS